MVGACAAKQRLGGGPGVSGTADHVMREVLHTSFRGGLEDRADVVGGRLQECGVTGEPVAGQVADATGEGFSTYSLITNEIANEDLQ